MPVAKVVRESRGVRLSAEIWEVLAEIAEEQELRVNDLLTYGAKAIILAYTRMADDDDRS